MANRASGGFTAAGTSAEVKGNQVDYKLTIPGTASVSLQAKSGNGEWVTVGSAVTATGAATVAWGSEQTWRLNATAVTNTVKNITDVTKANPAVVTSASHGFSNGNTVFIDSVPGMTEINGKTFVVANQATNTFELTGIDSTGYGVYGAPKNITGITKANPAVVTCPGHGLANGNSVKIAGVTGMTQVNGNTYTVAGATADTFQLSATDSSAYGVYGGPIAITALTPSASSKKAITGISKANPGSVTCVAHGFATGDKVRITGVTGMSEVNGVEYTATSTGTDTAGGMATRGPKVALTATSHGFTTADTVTFAGIVGTTDLNGKTYPVTVVDTNTLSLQGVDMTHCALFGGPTAPEITGITKANPAVVTTKAAHGFVDGDVVVFAGVVGMTQLNGNTYTVAGKTDTTFQLSGVNSSAYGTYGSPATITAITKANPGVVTAAAHGFSDGDIVYIAGVVGMTEVNGQYYTVANKDTNTFQLAGVNTSDYTAYTSGGTATKRGGTVRRNQSGTVSKVSGTASKIAGTASVNAVRYDLAATTDNRSQTLG
jgi:Ubiquitin-activating enzyme E1 FCCH domain